MKANRIKYIELVGFNLSDQKIELSDIQTLIDLRDCIQRFNKGELTELVNIDHQVLLILDWIDQTVQTNIRNVEVAKLKVQEAKQALSRCESKRSRDSDGRYSVPSCSIEEKMLQQAKLLLQKRQNDLEASLSWKKKIQEAIDEYHRASNRLSILINIQSEKACSELQRLGTKYESVQVSEQIASDLGQLQELSETQVEAIQRRDAYILQVTKAALRLSLISKIRSSEWVVLDHQARTDALKSVENCLAEIQGRKGFSVVVERMKPNQMGYFDGKRLHLNESLLKSDQIQETVNTIIHEGRHAYQRYAIDHPGFHSDANQVRVWRTNFRNYLDPELYGYELYRNQQVEKDAFDYADAISKELFN